MNSNKSMLNPWIFCDRCRALEVGWNRRYVFHSLSCRGGISRSMRSLALVLVAASGIVLFPTWSPAPAPETHPVAPAFDLADETLGGGEQSFDPAVAAIEDLLARHTRVGDARRVRIARAVIDSSRRHDVDPFLVTGVLIAESSGNPHAISNRQAVGIMQIHVPTWGPDIDAEGINLLRIEDNIDFGTRILREYTRRYGLWDGVMRYLGASEPTEEAMAYVRRVQGVYSDRQAD